MDLNTCIYIYVYLKVFKHPIILLLVLDMEEQVSLDNFLANLERTETVAKNDI